MGLGTYLPTYVLNCMTCFEMMEDILTSAPAELHVTQVYILYKGTLRCSKQ
jgi:hypothetical protein